VVGSGAHLWVLVVLVDGIGGHLLFVGGGGHLLWFVSGLSSRFVGCGHGPSSWGLWWWSFVVHHYLRVVVVGCHHHLLVVIVGGGGCSVGTVNMLTIHIVTMHKCHNA
jgi:hypothetical protein